MSLYATNLCIFHLVLPCLDLSCLGLCCVEWTSITIVIIGMTLYELVLRYIIISYHIISHVLLFYLFCLFDLHSILLNWIRFTILFSILFPLFSHERLPHTHTRTRTHTYIWIYVPSYDSYILLQKLVSEESYSSDSIISYLI